MGGWEGEFLVSRFMEPLHVAETTIPKVLSADYRPPPRWAQSTLGIVVSSRDPQAHDALAELCTHNALRRSHPLAQHV